jgi:rhodanese-related sulfurtransferase
MNEGSSARAAQHYESLGLKASALRGGFDAWVQAGLKTAPKESSETKAA